MTDAPARSRATALPAAERRAEIVASTTPLVMAHGTAVTTRQIAEAAGIAEGTIFRVFPDKDALIDAVIDAAFDPAPTEAALRAVDPGLPLERRLAEAVDIMRRRAAGIFQLMTSVGLPRLTGEPADPSGRRRLPGLEALVVVFEPDADQLRCSPEKAAHLLRGMTLVGTHPALVLAEPMSSAEIVSLVLDGLRAGPADTLRSHPDTHAAPRTDPTPQMDSEC